MQIIIRDSKKEMGDEAAWQGASLIREAIENKGYANIILATGASQFEMLEALIKEDIDWTVVTVFHLDEYLGIPVSHPASFRKYLKERVADKVDLKEFVYVDGENDPQLECDKLGRKIKDHPIDVAFIGIGENAHLAFNDPPADFETEEAYIVVDLDEACRKQQHGEGWFPTFDDVPKRAISMSIKQIMKSGSIICTVPDGRKADAVKKALTVDISPEIPASKLQDHKACWLYLDKESAALLK